MISTATAANFSTSTSAAAAAVVTPQAPMLNLRMRNPTNGKKQKRVYPSSLGASSSSCSANDDDHHARMEVMLRQDRTSYRCEDYLNRRAKHIGKRGQAPSCGDRRQAEAAPEEDPVDAVCREKMCEWSYRVCDHFHCGREIVAVAFSYLDRFIDRCACDRTAFKLAAMTTLYMATKVINSKQISIKSLSDLSRGEFDTSHIAEMEMIILQTLEWRMHPPTSQAFIENLLGQLGFFSADASLGSIVHQRATFFAEIALYDAAFVSMERSVIAIASILNAMEGIDDSVLSRTQQDEFMRTASGRYGQTYQDVDYARNRLWYIYSMSAQCQADEPATPPSAQYCAAGGSSSGHVNKDAAAAWAAGQMDLEHSPVSVATSH
eukprot:CAMPEP_0119565316 /NCGR_PEP_ID=MMETSP1352-20130426/29590_1 /TAXON_ID=265584 /ORGANISM="Stauroneis constricta, Strain CCMP1120" /LENGTH=377 /DNA_ID=CAMNT_0007614195 /DNA_START=316 /DNA_END=1449 /DNA_ORIENTATION=+